MRRLSFLLRPGWLALIALVAVFAYLCFTVLAPWQLGKNTRNSARNDRISAALHEDPEPLGQALGDGAAVTDADEWRPVTATGTYLADKQVLARLRTVDDQPAYEVLAPFRLDSGGTVIVDRGYVRPGQQSQPPPVPAPPAGAVTLDGRLRKAEAPVRDHTPVVDDDWTQVYSIDPGAVGEVTGLHLADGYMQLDADQPGGLGVIGLPNLDSGPYLSYGLQWLAFGIMAPLGAGYFAWSEIRERRRKRERQERLAAASTDAAAPGADVPGAADDPAPARTTRSDGGSTDGARSNENPTAERASDDPPADRHPPDGTIVVTRGRAGVHRIANDDGDPEGDEFAHVLKGRRKRRAPRRSYAEIAQQQREDALTDTERRTLDERYGKKS